MYTIDDIKNVVFARAGRGYSTEEVDEFIEEVVVTIQTLQMEKQTLMQKMGVLADRIEEYREQEQSIQNALLTAQRTADRLVREAKETADSLQEGSKSQIDQIEQEARHKAALLSKKAEEDYQAKMAEAKAQSLKIISEAKDRSGRMLFDALEKSRNERAALEELQRQNQGFRSRLIAMYQDQIALIQRFAGEEEPVGEFSMEEPSFFAEEPVEEPISMESVLDLSEIQETMEMEEPMEDSVEEPELAEVPQEAEEPSLFSEPSEVVDEKIEEALGENKVIEMLASSRSGHTRFQIDLGADLEEDRVSKFADLKFGDDYDIADDDDYPEEDTPGGFFKKKKK